MDPLANRRFAEFAKRFEPVVHDSRDGFSDLAKKYSLRNARAYFLVLDSQGKEIGRYGTYKKFEFDDEVVGILESFETQFRRSQTEVFEYLLTWIDSDVIEPSRFDELVSELNSPKSIVREAATQTLVSLGEPAYQFLLKYQPTNAEARKRVLSIVGKLKIKHDVIVRNGLDHDISYLIEHMDRDPVVRDYLKRILPATVETSVTVETADIKKFWKENGDRCRWNAKTQRFIFLEND